MTVDDRTRLNLHRKLEAVLGTKEADTLMAHLPPVSWNEVSTKDDLATLGTTLRACGQPSTTRSVRVGQWIFIPLLRYRVASVRFERILARSSNGRRLNSSAISLSFTRMTA